jgi:hypothetical protein
MLVTAARSLPRYSLFFDVVGSDEGRALQKFHVGERFLLRQFTPHSVPQAYR